MTTGARSTEQWREHRALLEAIQRGGPTPDPLPAQVAAEQVPEPVPTPLAARAIAIALAVVALLWVAAVVTALQPEAAPVAALAAQASLASGPLALIGIVYLLLQRTSRREATRFGQTAAAMRSEAVALEAAMARLGARLDDERKATAEQTQALVALGEDASLRLAEISARMQRETQALGGQADRLETSAAGLFADLGIVVTDLPRLQGEVDALAERLRDTGREAEARIAALSGELSRLTVEARDAEEVAGGAAQRLGAHLARIEGLGAAVGERVDGAAEGIARTVDAALTRTAEAVETTRASIDAQSAALLAMVTQSRAAFDRAGDEATAALEARVAAIRAETEALDATRGAALDAIATAAARFDELAERGAALDAQLAQTAARAESLAGSASGQLVEALLRVRETAAQAAEHAGRAFSGVIQQAAARLGEEGGAAIEARLGGLVETKLGEIAALAEQASVAGEAAARRLTVQTAALAAGIAAIERFPPAPIEGAAEGEDAGVSARVAQLIDQLNATAVDVTRLLASEVPDTLWAAYLKGDRGLFTRRAARLVEASEAKEIARRFEEEPPFRAQVDRYIHDFEAMLRHILAMPDGSMVAVTLLSSDMGKLYVAIAQAIERLRA